jgi:hypothetical protein
MQAIRPNQLAGYSAERLVEIDERRTLAGGHGANLIVRRDDIVCAETAAGSVHADRALR